MLEIKNEYKGKKIYFGLDKTTLIVDEIDKRAYKYYNENGLDFIFVTIKSVKKTTNKKESK